MGKRKYPLSMSIMGTVIFLLKSWYVLILAALSIIANIIFSDFPSYIIGVIIAAWVLVAIIRQIISQRELLSMNSNEELTDLLDKMFEDNCKGYKNVTDTLDEIISEQIDNQDESK